MNISPKNPLQQVSQFDSVRSLPSTSTQSFTIDENLSSSEWKNFSAKELVDGLKEHFKTHNPDVLKGYERLINQICFGEIEVNSQYMLDKKQNELNNLAQDLGVRSHALGRAFHLAKTPKTLIENIQLEIDYCKVHEFKKKVYLVIIMVNNASTSLSEYVKTIKNAPEELQALELLNTVMLNKTEAQLFNISSGFRLNPIINTQDEENVIINTKNLLDEIKSDFKEMHDRIKTNHSDLTIEQIDNYSDLTRALAADRKKINTDFNAIEEAESIPGVQEWQEQKDFVFKNYERPGILALKVKPTNFFYLLNSVLTRLKQSSNSVPLPASLVKEFETTVNDMRDKMMQDITSYSVPLKAASFQNIGLIESQVGKQDKEILDNVSRLNMQLDDHGPVLGKLGRWMSSRVVDIFDAHKKAYYTLCEQVNSCIRKSEGGMANEDFISKNLLSTFRAFKEKDLFSSFDDAFSAPVKISKKKSKNKKQNHAALNRDVGMTASFDKSSMKSKNNKLTKTTETQILEKKFEDEVKKINEETNLIVAESLDIKIQDIWHNPTATASIKNFIRDRKNCSGIVPPLKSDGIKPLRDPKNPMLQTIDIYPSRSPLFGESIEEHLQRRHSDFLTQICPQGLSREESIQQIGQAAITVLNNMTNATIQTDAVYQPNKDVVIAFPVLLIDGLLNDQQVRVALSKPFYSNVDASTPNATSCLVIRSIYPLSSN